MQRTCLFENRISYLAIGSGIAIERGYFRDVLAIHLENGEVLRFGGVAKKPSRPLKVDAVVDPFQGATTCITALPGGTAVRRRDEDAPILLGDVDADNASIIAGIHLPR